MVTLSGCRLIQTKGFLVLKSIFSLILCQVLQDGLLFLGFDMFFMISRLWHRINDIDLKAKFLSEMCKVLQGHLIVASLWYRSIDFSFEISFVYESVPSAWSILIISVVKHVLFSNLPLIQASNHWFLNHISQVLHGR